MRLNWFGPLPPASGPESLYAARLLPFLKGRADVVLWTPQPLHDPGLERWAEVRASAFATPALVSMWLKLSPAGEG